MDTQCYFIVCGSAPNPEEPDVFQTWGHSGVVDPWGKITSTAEFEETIIYDTVDLKVVEENRDQIWVFKHKRDDLYKLEKMI